MRDRIADLERDLAEAKAGWDSCIADLRTAAQICKQTEDQLAEARKAAEWTLITPENPLKIGDEAGKHTRSGYFERLDVTSKFRLPKRVLDEGWIYRRHLNPPAPKGSKP